MGRAAINVNKEKLQEVINAAESNGIFTTRGALWKEVEKSDYAKSIRLKASMAAVRAKELGCEIKTPLGKRGAALRSFKAAGIKTHRVRRTISLEVVEKIRRAVPEKYHKKVDKLAVGSLKNAVFIKCMDCSGYVMREVAQCPVDSCSLHPYRPYQTVRDYSKQGSTIIEENPNGGIDTETEA